MSTAPAIPATQSSGRRICLFAEYHRAGRLPAATIRYADAMRRAGLAVHLACSGQDRIDEADKLILERIGIAAYPRPNAGLDFGAWQDLIERGCADGADEVLLANDSVFGPFRPLRPIIRSMAGFDAWGMVESREGRPHLQSWFVWMSGESFRRPAVRRVFAQPFGSMSKTEIIVHGELGLSAAFEAEKLDVGARYQARFRIRPSALVATNPMHFRWRRLLGSGAVPFLKSELLRDNPSRIMGLDDWPSLLDAGDAAWIGEMLTASAGTAAARLPLSAKQVLLQMMLREDRLDVVAGWLKKKAGLPPGLRPVAVGGRTRSR